MGFAVISELVYRASDKKLLIGTHGNGMFHTTVEGTLSTSEFNRADSFTLYPNPTSSELNIKSENFNLNGSIQFEITDITGKVVNNGIINNKKLDVENLNSGVYFLGLNVNGNKKVIKFIRE